MVVNIFIRHRADKKAAFKQAKENDMVTKRDMWRNLLFITLPTVVVTAILLIGIWKVTKDDDITRGKDINRLAWESSYTERSLPLPISGPREGYWGARLGPKIYDPAVGWHESAINIPGLLEIDEYGQQHDKYSADNPYHILILGGSVAFGAYASEISKTYFHIIDDLLANEAIYADITIIASGAWKSSQEVAALKHFNNDFRPDLIVFLDGLNDLTNGATSKTLYGQKIKTADGSPWNELYHTHDYQQRVSDYLLNIATANKLAKNLGSDLLVVLQPSLAERRKRTKIEKILLAGALKPHTSHKILNQSYSSIRDNLYRLAQSEGFYFLDCSEIFNNQEKTTFADMWHFSDIGHQILGETMAKEISIVLKHKSQLSMISKLQK